MALKGPTRRIPLPKDWTKVHVPASKPVQGKGK
jgi:hypothetical protein